MNWFVLIVAMLCQLKIVKNMEKIILSSNVNIVAALLSGFAGKFRFFIARGNTHFCEPCHQR
jgi:hypothetical protein